MQSQVCPTQGYRDWALRALYADVFVLGNQDNNGRLDFPFLIRRKFPERRSWTRRPSLADSMQIELHGDGHIL